MSSSSQEFKVGSGMALFATAVPDWALGVVDKILLALITGFCSALAYKAGSWVWDRAARVRARKAPRKAASHKEERR